MLLSRRSHPAAAATRLLLTTLALLALAAIRPGIADAQIPAAKNRLHIIYDNGSPVGAIYVDRERGAAQYVEHWVMFPTYTYPSEIRPNEQNAYTSADEFLASIPFGPGYRYARLDIAKTASIPGR